MKSKYGGKRIISINDAAQENLRVPQATMQAIPSRKLELNVKRMLITPIQGLASLCQQLIPQSIRESLQMSGLLRI